MFDFDFKASLKSQMDRMMLTPDDLARGLGIRVSSVLGWIDPVDETTQPAKQAFDWLDERADELDSLLEERLLETNRTIELFGHSVLPWFRESDVAAEEYRGTQNFATQLVVKYLENKGRDVDIVFAERSDEWIERHLEDVPYADTKAMWSYKLDVAGLTTADVAYSLEIQKLSVKRWGNPGRTEAFPPADAWRFVEDFEKKVQARADELIDEVDGQDEPTLPYHAAGKTGFLSLENKIENRAALQVGAVLMAKDITPEYRFA